MLNKKGVSTFFIVIIYASSFYIVQLFLSEIHIFPISPTLENIVSWDAGWYLSIATEGYKDNAGASSNSGFYFLFPLVWSLIHYNIIGILILNIIFFAAGFTILSNLYSLSVNDTILWLSTPSLFFIFVPYSEALFFLLVAITLYGIIHKKIYLIWIGLFLAALCRSTVVFLIPAFLVMELLVNNRNEWYKSFFRYLFTYAFPLLAGLAVFVWYQYYETGVWFAYFKQQSSNWGHKLAMPVLPFGDFEGHRLIWLNAMAMFTALIALIILIRKGFLWLSRNIIEPNRILSLSLSYLVVTMCFIIFFNPTWTDGGRTMSAGMHRYTLATPFFFAFLADKLKQETNYKLRNFIGVFVLANIVWLAFGSYIHIQQWLLFNVNFLLILLYMLYASKRYLWASIAIAAFNIMVQHQLFQIFISRVTSAD